MFTVLMLLSENQIWFLHFSHNRGLIATITLMYLIIVNTLKKYLSKHPQRVNKKTAQIVFLLPKVV